MEIPTSLDANSRQRLAFWQALGLLAFILALAPALGLATHGIFVADGVITGYANPLDTSSIEHRETLSVGQRIESVFFALAFFAAALMAPVGIFIFVRRLVRLRREGVPLLKPLLLALLLSPFVAAMLLVTLGRFVL